MSYLKDTLHSFISKDIKFKVKLMVAGLLAVIFSYCVKLPLSACVIVVLYAMIIVQTSIGATLSTLKSLTFWIVLGTLSGMFALLLLRHSFEIHPDLIWFVIAFFVAVGAFLMPIDRLARLGLATAILVLVFGEASHSALGTALLRGACLLMSVLIGLASSYFIFPERASEKLSRSIQDYMNKTMQFYREISFHCFSLDKINLPEWDAERRARRALSMRKEISSFSELLDFARKDGLNYSDDFFQSIILVKNRLVTFLFDYLQSAINVHENPIFEVAREPLQALSDAIEESLLVWSSVIQFEGGALSLPDLAVIEGRIEAALKAHRTLIQQASVEELTDFFAFYNLLQRFSRRMVSRIERTRKALSLAPTSEVR